MRDGNIYLVVLDVLLEGKKDILFIGPGWMPGEAYDDNLICESFNEFDIMEVYTIYEDQDHFAYGFMDLERRHSIWKRQEYTEEQKEIFKALKLLGFNYIARDEDDDLVAYDVRPNKTKAWWYNKSRYNAYTNRVFNKQLDFIKWEDTEPFEIPTL